MNTIESGRRVVRIEAQAVHALEQSINTQFEQAVDLIYSSKGRVIITGMGKSGIVARKIVATMNSTGTSSIFLHPSDAVHGDLGMVRKEDVVICISKSGDTEEIRELLPLFKRLGVKIISIVGTMRSPLAQQSDVALDVSVREEACPHDLAPTSSTTVTIVMGDALAVALLEKRGFTKEDFARVHPGGNLGKRLLLRIEELMTNGPAVPVGHQNVPLSDAIYTMTSKRLGATCVVDDAQRLVGIITDGDLRRLLQQTNNISGVTAAQAMTSNPKVIHPGMLAVNALEVMESFNITQLVVVGEDHIPVGVIHLHDLVKAGLRTDV